MHALNGRNASEIKTTYAEDVEYLSHNTMKSFVLTNLFFESITNRLSIELEKYEHFFSNVFSNYTLNLDKCRN